MRDLATPLVTAPMPSVVKPLSLSDKKTNIYRRFLSNRQKKQPPFPPLTCSLF